MIMLSKPLGNAQEYTYIKKDTKTAHHHPWVKHSTLAWVKTTPPKARHELVCKGHTHTQTLQRAAAYSMDAAGLLAAAGPRLGGAIASREICASLLLQQLLYYGAFASPAWLLAVGARTYIKYGRGLALPDPDVARTVLVTFWLLAEPLRLFAGFYGNLQENVPWLVVFSALTLVPQTAVCYYLMLAAWDLRPADQALQLAMAALIHAQLFAAAAAVFKMFRAQRRQFYLLEHALRQQRR